MFGGVHLPQQGHILVWCQHRRLPLVVVVEEVLQEVAVREEVLQEVGAPLVVQEEVLPGVAAQEEGEIPVLVAVEMMTVLEEAHQMNPQIR